MKAIISKLKTFCLKLLDRFKSPLPLGVTQFDAWSDSIIDRYGLPPNDTSKWALAVMILHMPETKFYATKREFGLKALKSLSNQTAGQIMQDLKAKQAAEAAAAAAATNNPAIAVEWPKSENQQS